MDVHGEGATGWQEGHRAQGQYRLAGGHRAQGRYRLAGGHRAQGRPACLQDLWQGVRLAGGPQA